MSKRGSNSELFAHENDTLTARSRRLKNLKRLNQLFEDLFPMVTLMFTIPKVVSSNPIYNEKIFDTVFFIILLI